jgi:hypothetical protein
MTVPVFAGSDDSWLPGGVRSFCFFVASILKTWLVVDGRQLENCTNRIARSCRHACSLRFAGIDSGAGCRHISLRHFGRKSNGLLFSRFDRAIYNESAGHFAGLAHRNCRWILWSLHDFFELWMGDGENDRRWRMGARFGIRGCKCGRWIVAVRGGHSTGQQILREELETPNDARKV